MSEKLKIGDKVRLNKDYFEEGLNFFGKNLLYPNKKNHFFTIEKIEEIKGNPSVIHINSKEYKQITLICERFLEKI